MNRHHLLCCIATAWAHVACAASWPVLGLLDADEGTIELWVKFAFDPMARHKGYRGRGAAANVNWGDAAYSKDGLDIVFHTKEVGPPGQRHMECKARIEIRIGGLRRRPLQVDVGRDAKRDTWYHLAIAWRDGEISAYFNGQAKATGKGFRPALSSAGSIKLGSGPLTIDDFRISSVVRSPKEMGDHAGALEPDRFTLLLLSFDRSTAGKPIAPTHVALDPDRPQTATGRKRFVPGKFGKSAALGP